MKRILIRECPVFSERFDGKAKYYPEGILKHILYRLEQLEKGEVQPKCDFDLSLRIGEPISITRQEREFFNTHITCVDEECKKTLRDTGHNKSTDNLSTQADSNNFWRNTLLSMLAAALAILALVFILVRLKRPAPFVMG